MSDSEVKQLKETLDKIRGEKASKEGVTPHVAAVRFAEDRIRREGSGTTFRHGGGE